MLSENSNISWILKRIGDIQTENRPRPSPKPNEVEIAVKVTGICGSDGIDKLYSIYFNYSLFHIFNIFYEIYFQVHYWVHGHIGNFIVKEPMVLGHESSGIVTNVGVD